MVKTEQVRCPNCGSLAERQYFPNNQVTQVSCPACDYLLAICPQTGKVLESYAPGITASCC